MPENRSTLTKVVVGVCVGSALLVMSWLSPPTTSMSLAAGFTPSAEPTTVPQPTIAPQPTTAPQPTEAPQPPDDHKGEPPSDCPPASIRGAVVDLCQGQPAAGVQVSINGIMVTTDSQGTYSLTGLGPGDYFVTVAVDSAWKPSSQTVRLDCNQTANVDLSFNSCLAPAATEAAPLLPVTGASQPPSAPLGFLALAGFVLAALGLAVWVGGKQAR